MESAPRRTPADQDRQLAADLAEMARVLTAARDDADAQATLGPAEFDPVALDAILAEVASAQDAFRARATAMGAEEAAQKAKDDAYESARSSYMAFRKVARARFRRDEDALDALGLNGDAPRALDPLLTKARTGYAAAQTEPYFSRLGRGYTAERLDALLGEVQSLDEAARAYTAARARAKAATQTRDTEADGAREDYAEFRDTARAILPPDLLDRIGLG